MSDLFGAGSEDLDWTSDLGVSKPFTFNLLACLKTRFSTCRPLSKVKIMLEVLIKLKLYVYKNDSNVNFFYFRLFPAQWMNGLQTVADPDLKIRWGPVFQTLR